MKKKIGLVFVHGAGLGPWIWERMVAGWEQPALLLTVPEAAGEDRDRHRLTLDDYVQHMNRQIGSWSANHGIDSFVIVAHSLGGVLSLRLAADWKDKLAGWIAVGAAIPARGGSFLSALPVPQRWIMSIIMKLAGTRPPESAIRSGLCSDLTQDMADEVVRQFVPESIRVYKDRVQAPVPDGVKKWYIKLMQDREFGLALQERMIANMSPDEVVELDTGHLPMLRDPGGLRRIVQTILDEHVNRLTA